MCPQKLLIIGQGRLGTRAGNTERNSVFRYFGTTGGTFGHRNIEYNIGTDIDTEGMILSDFFGIFEFPAPTNNLHDIYTRVVLSVYVKFNFEKVYVPNP